MMDKHGKLLCGIVVLVAGILYALKDLGAWNVLGIEAWPTAVFFIAGLCLIFGGCGKKK